MVLAGCQEDDFGMGGGPAKIGDEILFGGTAGYSSKTRTVYGDKWENYTEIRWYAGDKVRIYCGQAESGDDAVKYCDYNVVDGLSTTENPKNGKTEENDEHFSQLTAIGESGLRWGSETSHVFYGVYPAPGQLANESADALSKEAAGKLKLEGNVLTGYLPNRQTPLSGTNFVQKTTTGYIVHPAMRYAYMVATNTVDPKKTNAVSLSFEPIVTAVEITLVNNSGNYVDGELDSTVDIPNIQGFRVASDNVICGDFTTDVNGKSTTVSSTGDSYKQIFIPAEIEKLEYGNSVTFTVFMMLDKTVKGLENLTATIITTSGQKSAKLNGKGGDIIVYAQKKNFLSNVPLDLGVVSTTLNAGNWIAHVPNQIDGQDVLVRTLSIPGAGGAASYTQYEANPEYAQQSLTISEQWAQGIRCFEFAVDRPGGGVTFGQQEIVCNGRSTGVKLKEAVDAVVTELRKSPKEFAMVILTYENLGGWADAQDVDRDPASFMSGLKTFWEGYSAVTALYDPAKTTMADARDKLFCIARPTSTGQDDFTYSAGGSIGITGANAAVSYDHAKLNVASGNIHQHILVVNGWGNLKDKWINRGYTSCLFHRGAMNRSDNNLQKAIGYQTGYLGRPFDVATNGAVGNTGNYSANLEDGTASNTGVNFFYGTQAGNSSSTRTDETAWIQEWARVCPAGGISGSATFRSGFFNTEKTGYYYWAPTIAEKELRISETLDFAINKTKGSILYINSLCGYFISNDYPQSCNPHDLTDKSGNYYSTLTGKYWCGTDLSARSEYAGMEGDIDTFASYINNYFYSLLSEKQAAGELNDGIGIVLMDRVSDSAETDPAGYYIPQLIWTNNTFDVAE